MTSETPKSLGELNYEKFAHRYAEIAKTKPHNAYYERPATRSLMPDVAGKRILDAGCGPGFNTEWLLDQGAVVVAFDVTPDFVTITRGRVGDRAVVYRADLTQPLDFAEDASFDGALCPLVLDYIEDWMPVMEQFYRILKPGGWLVFSCGHPMGDWFLASRIGAAQRYYDVEMFEYTWKGFGEPYPVVKGYRRPLQDMIGPVLAAGFQLDRLLEPQPVEALREIDPEEYARLDREPAFLCVRARK
jgi:SAM-dependent methyltransferase